MMRYVFAALVAASLFGSSQKASAQALMVAPTTCAELAAVALRDQTVNERQGALVGDRQKRDRKVLSASSAIVPATPTTNAYCRLKLRQAPSMNIVIGLPLSAADGGVGGVQGAWNGKVENLGVGGNAGRIIPVTPATNQGFVGSATDSGHDPEWCNSINPRTGKPNAQRDCGLDGGGFILDEAKVMNWEQAGMYLHDGPLSQTLWALAAAQMYYGRDAQRNYWNGCSGGGRQGFILAQRYPQLFDGFLIGAPAININRFIQAEEWPTVVASTLPNGILAPAKSAAAQAAAIAHCGKDYGPGLGIIAEARRCRFDAKTLICKRGSRDDATCLTPQEASVINRIWDGPRDAKGRRLWGGMPRGAPFNSVLPNGGAGVFGGVRTWTLNWTHQDPDFDMRRITPENFEEVFEKSYYLYENPVENWGVDNVDLDALRKRGAKIVLYHGGADPITSPFGTQNYVTRVFDRYGVTASQDFLRTFYFPGSAHCRGGIGPQIDTDQLFGVLQEWVEYSRAPDFIVASGKLADGAAISRPICKYPDQATYKGSGSLYDARNFSCKVVTREPADLAGAARSTHDHPERDPALRAMLSRRTR